MSEKINIVFKELPLVFRQLDILRKRHIKGCIPKQRFIRHLTDRMDMFRFIVCTRKTHMNPVKRGLRITDAVTAVCFIR